MREKTLIQRIGPANWSILLPLGGLKLAYLSFLGAWYLDLLVNYGVRYDDLGNVINQPMPWMWSRWVYLLGFILVSLASLFGLQISRTSGDSKFARAGRQFATVAVIISLVVTAIFTFATFMTSFESFGYYDAPTLTQRLFNVYGPIIVAAAVEIFVILKAFVTKKGADEDE